VDITGWEKRYRSTPQSSFTPTPLLVENVSCRNPGRALDIACGTGRNAIWLAEKGWSVTAVDGSAVAISVLKAEALSRRLKIAARVADLEAGFTIEARSWELIVMSFYLQRDLFEPAKLGLLPGGVLIAIVHITEPGEEPTAHRLRPGELRSYFEDFEILSYREGRPTDPEHRRLSAEIVARRPVSPEARPAITVR
jgi:tellurite methyltransferase